MSKLKTHSGTKDRVKITKKGKVLRRSGNINHFLQKKSASRKRRLHETSEVYGSIAKSIKRNLGK